MYPPYAFFLSSYPSIVISPSALGTLGALGASGAVGALGHLSAP